MVSVIIPIYNAEHYLWKCLESIKKQTYSDIEVIMIDDGSVDSSVQIEKKFVETDIRFQVYLQQNSGVSTARNVGLDKANGEYIIFIDSDDYIEPIMIEMLVRSLEDYNTDIACCQYDHGNQYEGASTEVWDKDKAIREFLIHKQINGSLVNKLFRRKAIENIRLDPVIKYGEDALFLWKVLINVKSISISDQVLYHVTLHEDSASGGGSYKPIRKDCIKVWSEICNDAVILGSSYVDLARAQLGNMAFFSVYLMAYYNYKNKTDTEYYCNAIRKTIKQMKSAEFITKKEIILASLFWRWPYGGRLVVKAKKKLKK